MKIEMTFHINDIPHYEEQKFLIAIEELTQTFVEIKEIIDNKNDTYTIVFNPEKVVSKSSYYLQQICYAMDLELYRVFEITYNNFDDLEAVWQKSTFDLEKSIKECISYRDENSVWGFGKAKEKIEYIILFNRLYELKK
jgi:hypothetical protein